MEHKQQYKLIMIADRSHGDNSSLYSYVVVFYSEITILTTSAHFISNTK